MGQENRQSQRYPEIGRIIAPELCALPGILDNISFTGCKIHFPVSVVVDLDSEYMIKVTLSRSIDVVPLQLMCKPMWVKENQGVTSIGLQILYSPDDARLREFITYLQEMGEEDDDELPDVL
ncbi:MAG: PilZ domain-containing protein [Treponema sp.]|nr:PilZ domain-containing protein [Treponema sp.]